MHTNALTLIWRCAAMAALVAASGCSSDHLVFTTYTKVGLDVSTADGQMVNGTFGYKRFEGAIIPVDPPKDATGAEPKVASVFAGMAVKNSWLNGLDLAQVFGTGAAAERLAATATPALGEVLSLGMPPAQQPGKTNQGQQ